MINAKNKKGFNLRISAWSAIINAALFLPFLIIALVSVFSKENLGLRNASLILAGLMMITGIFISQGLVALSRKCISKFLRNMGYLSIIALLIVTLSGVLAFLSRSILFIALSAVMLLLAGTVLLLLGISLLALEKDFKGLLLSLAILCIIGGFCLSSIIFAWAMPLLIIPIDILEAILFFRAAKKYS